MAPRKNLIFQFVQCIFVVRTGVTSKFFTYWSLKQVSFIFILKDIFTGITILSVIDYSFFSLTKDVISLSLGINGF